MPSCDAIWCRSLKGLRSSVDMSVILLYLSCFSIRKYYSRRCTPAFSKLESLRPDIGLEGMDGVYKSYHTGLGGHNHRVRPGTAPEVPDPIEGLSLRDAGRCEDHFIATNKIVQGELPLRVAEAELLKRLDLRALGRPHLGLDLAAQTLYHHRGQNALRRPSDTYDGVQVCAVQSYGDGWSEISFESQLNARSSTSYLLDEIFMPFSVQNRDRYLGRLASVGLSYSVYILGYRRVDVDVALRLRPHNELAHIHVWRP